jgi:uncharacterized protein YlxW (UPF0749 family)
MTEISITEAMKLTGKSRPTLYRHIKSGKLSKTSNGGIDTSELRRVYGEFETLNVTNENKVVTKSIKTEKKSISQIEKDETEIQHLKEQLEMLKSQLSKTEYQLERSQQKEDKLLQLIENRLPPPDEDSVVNRLKRKFL